MMLRLMNMNQVVIEIGLTNLIYKSWQTFFNAPYSAGAELRLRGIQTHSYKMHGVMKAVNGRLDSSTKP
ncbi:hypothetical protein XELAEV_18043427mg [Xenopus laevis]|uniref:Uncharacterized protein n=1 Tax=Xenopus laevis TaxID=8355 RepID=A0A974BWX7_XENLA|nr:hypothetical protein XELAEV_18043427mg [Xenopus laevis]